MVYSCVYLVAGVLIDRKTAAQKGYIDRDGFVEGIYDGTVHSYPCCSDIAREKFVLGRVVHTFNRVKVEKCGKNLDGTEKKEDEFPDRRRSERNIKWDEFKVCGKYYSCKTCIGTTNGGSRRWFDVESILNTIVEYDPEQICSSCYDVEYIRGQPCQTCGWTGNGPASPPAYDLTNQHKPKFYLMINDCLSCS